MASLDNAVSQLTDLLKEGLISYSVFAEGLNALKTRARSTPKPRPTPKPRKQVETRPTPKPRKQVQTRPTPKPRKLTNISENDLQLLNTPIPKGLRLKEPLIPIKSRGKWLSNEEFDQIFSSIIPKKTKRPPAARSTNEEEAEIGSEPEFIRTKWVIGKFLKGYEMKIPRNHKFEALSPKEFLLQIKPQIETKLKKELKSLGGLKYQLAVRTELSKTQVDGTIEYIDATFRNKQAPILQSNEIEESIINEIPQIQESFEKWIFDGSQWTLVRVDRVWLDIATYEPFRGSSYIDLPPEVKSKQAVINVKNMDDHCLRWAIRAATSSAPPHHPERTGWYPINDDLNFTGIDAPTPISQIKKVEK